MKDLNGREYQIGDDFVPTAVGGTITGFRNGRVIFVTPDGTPGSAEDGTGYSKAPDADPPDNWNWYCMYKVCIP